MKVFIGIAIAAFHFLALEELSEEKSLRPIRQAPPTTAKISIRAQELAWKAFRAEKSTPYGRGMVYAWMVLAYNDTSKLASVQFEEQPQPQAIARISRPPTFGDWDN